MVIVGVGWGCLTLSPASAHYTVDYGDSLSISVKNASQFDYAGPIRPDGHISIPYVGELNVLGLSTESIRERVRAALGPRWRRADVSVVVTAFRPRTVFLFGEVVKPGVVELSRPNVTVLDAISQAAGFTERAAKANVVLYRGVGDNAKKYPINAEQMLNTGDFTDNLAVQDGDRIQVPAVWYPDFRAISGNLTPVLSVLTALVVVFNMVDRNN
jgi:polysaccharide export outer membrane protein